MSLFETIEMRTALTAHQAMGTAALMRWMRDSLPLYPPSKARMEAARTGLIALLEQPEVDAPNALNAMLQVWSEGPAIESTTLLEAIDARATKAASRAHALAWTHQALTFAPTALCALLHARLTELHYGPSARVVEALGRARVLAEREGDEARALRARIEEVRVLSRIERHTEALVAADATAKPARGFTSRDALILARAKLHAPSMYKRTAALDALNELLDSPYPAVQHAVWRTLFAHTEGQPLSAPEADRLHTMAHRFESQEAHALRQWLLLQTLDETAVRAERVRLLASDDAGRLQGARLRAILDGGTAGPRPTQEADLSAWLALHGFVALRDKRTNEARQALVDLEARAALASVAGWTFVRRALREPALHPQTLPLITRWLSAPGIAPARGFRDIASLLVRVNENSLATKALLRALELREPQARQLLVAHQRREAFVAYEAPTTDRSQRAQALRDARTLLLAVRTDSSSLGTSLGTS
jgi:hypothetical protein